MRPLALSDAIAVAIEEYRSAVAEGRFIAIPRRAIDLADLVMEAYDLRQAEYDLLTPYQRGALARAWREHRRAEVIESRGGETAARPSLIGARQQTLDSLTARGVLDASGHLTEVGITLARRAWQEAGEVDAGEPV